MTARRVLCPVDFSPASGRALRAAAALVRRSAGRLTVLFVDDPLLLAAAEAAHDPRASAGTTAAALERFVRKTLAGAARPRVTRTIVSAGAPADEILKAAKGVRADLIVMGTRGRGRVARLMLGSTAEAVLRRTPVPVLAIPGS